MDRFSVFVLVMIVLALPVQAGEESKLDVGGMVFFDYFLNTTDGADQGTDPVKGFQLRRLHLTVKKSWGDMLFRYTSDIDLKYGTGNLNAYTKYAYLQWKTKRLPGVNMLFGQHSPMSHAWVEKRWHYRSMAKTMGDAQKWTHAGQLGVGLHGKAGDEALEYYLSFNNGNGHKEANTKDGIGFSSRVAFTPAEGLWLSGMFASNTPGDTEDEANTYFEGLVGYSFGAFEAYAQYGVFGNGNTPDEETETGLSIFGRFGVRDGTYLVGRFDMIDPDSDTDDDGHNWVLIGMDHEIHEGFFIQPSVRIKTFQVDGADSESEIVLTFFGKV